MNTRYAPACGSFVLASDFNFLINVQNAHLHRNLQWEGLHAMVLGVLEDPTLAIMYMITTCDPSRSRHSQSAQNTDHLFTFGRINQTCLKVWAALCSTQQSEWLAQIDPVQAAESGTVVLYVKRSFIVAFALLFVPWGVIAVRNEAVGNSSQTRRAAATGGRLQRLFH